MVLRIAFMFGVFLASVSEAHAYLDPGTGSYIFQLVIAGVIGGSFLVKTYWRRIINLLKMSDKKSSK